MEASPQVFRAPMRARDDRMPSGAAVERALIHGLCGMGGRLDQRPVALADAVQAADAAHGERLARRIERFAAAPQGSFVWTRDSDGLFWLGRLTGAWWYDERAEAVAVDLVHVRSCRWLDHPIDEGDVPSAVRASFGRGGRNWQSIRASSASPETTRLWDRLSDHPSRPAHGS